jgi:hypothetical protein
MWLVMAADPAAPKYLEAAAVKNEYSEELKLSSFKWPLWVS